ncbi:AsmA family protein [Marivibrio halodurans]|uniref:AsmA family protein n=1 Tax=Marivibrio halodurans TaxID=2039722 RepID=A0A8J7SN40_9PROT|nr:AsmA-like C-terminal region-containing protein [Marivibrio halodurans]MBP5857391.1 AsmA family protein [Marivibrio halodurans]
MKRLYWAAGLACAGLVGALFIAPRFVDWDAWKPDIEQGAAAWLNMPLAIDGNLAVDLLPSPRLTATQVTLGPADAPAATMRWVRASLDLRELIKGSIVLKSVRLVEPEVHINRMIAATEGASPDGATAPSGDGGSAAPNFLGGTDALNTIPFEIVDGVFRGTPIENLAVRLDDVDGTLSVRPGAGGIAAETGFDGAFTLASRRLSGGFRMQARDDGLRLGVELSAADVRADNPQGVSRLSFSGRSSGEDRGRIAGDLRITAGRLTALPWLPGAVMAEAERIAPGAVTLEGRLIADRTEETIRLEQASASTDDLRGTGGLGLSLAGRPRLNLTLSLASLDLTRLDEPSASAARGDLLDGEGEALGSEAALPALLGDTRPAGEAGPLALDDPARFPEALSARFAAFHAALLARVRSIAAASRAFDGIATTLDISADTLRLPGGVVRQAALRASASSGELLIERASALLPGGSDLAVFGFIDTDVDAPRFEGELALQSDDARRVLEWLGWEEEAWVRAIPDDRLRSVRLSASAVLDRESLRVSDILADIDAATLSGSAHLEAGTGGPRLSVDFDADSLNIDAYRGDLSDDPTGTDPASPDPAADAAGRGMVTDAGRPAPFMAGEMVQFFSRASAWAKALAGAPIAFDIDVGRVTAARRAYEGARFTLGTREGERRVTLSVDQVASIGLRAALRFPVEEARVDWRLALRVEGPDLGTSAAAFGASPHWTQRARAVEAGFLRATVDGNSAGLGFRADLGAGPQAIDGEARYQLTLGGVLSPGREGGYRLQVSQGRLLNRGRSFDGVQGVARIAHPFDAARTIAIDSARLNLLGGTLDVSGLAAAASAGGVDLDLRGGLTSIDLARAVGDIGPLVRVDGEAQLTGRLIGRDVGFVDPWAGLSGEGRLDGRASLAVRPGAAGQAAGVAQVERLANKLSDYFGGEGGALGGTFTLDAGHLSIPDLAVEASGARAAGRIDADLAEDRLDVRFSVREPSADSSYLELEARGPMTSLDVRTAGSWISGNR